MWQVGKVERAFGCASKSRARRPIEKSNRMSRTVRSRLHDLSEAVGAAVDRFEPLRHKTRTHRGRKGTRAILESHNDITVSPLVTAKARLACRTNRVFWGGEKFLSLLRFPSLH